MAKKGKDTMKKYAAKRRAQEVTATASPRDNGPVRSKSAEISRAENGFIVSQYIPGNGMTPGRDRKIVCKTMEEAQAQAAKLLKF